MILKGIKDIPHNGFVSIDTSNNKTTSTENPFSVIYKIIFSYGVMVSTEDSKSFSQGSNPCGRRIA